MSSAGRFQALAASSKSADRLRNQSMFAPELSKVRADHASSLLFHVKSPSLVMVQIIPEALSADAKALLRCVLVSVACKLPLAIEGFLSQVFSALF